MDKCLKKKTISINRKCIKLNTRVGYIELSNIIILLYYSGILKCDCYTMMLYYKTVVTVEIK